MPYFSNYSKDDNEDQAPGQGQTTQTGAFQRGASGVGANSTNPSSSGTITETPGAAEGSTQKNASNTGSNYQNIDSYLGANADSQFGNQVTSKVGEQQAKGYFGQQDAGQKFNKQVYGSTQAPTQDQISGAIENPITANPQEYQKWMNQSYEGPKSISDSQSISNDYWKPTQKAVEQTGAVSGNDAGQYSLLNSYFGGPAGSSSYSSNMGPTGQQALDLSLAQNTQGYGQNVANLKRGASQLQQMGNMGAQQLQNNASMQAGAVEQSANAARGAIGIDKNGQIIQGPGAGAIGKYESEINQGVTDANAGIAKQVSELNAGGALSQDFLDQLGITGDTYGTNLGKFISQGPALTAANTMTPEQLSKLKALQGLAGVSSSLAGTNLTKGNGFTFDKAGAQGAVNDARSASDKTAYTKGLSDTTVQLPGMALGGGGLFGTGIGGSNQTSAHDVSIADLQTILDAIQSGPDKFYTNSGLDPRSIGAGNADPNNPIAKVSNQLGLNTADWGALQNFARQAQPIYLNAVNELKKKHNQT